MEKKLFDYTAKGEAIDAYTMQAGELKATVLTYGGILQSFCVGDKDIVFGYDSYADYVHGGGSHGALIGRYANRIADGRFVLNGKTYLLEKNEKGRTHLHGGANGFGVRIWTAQPKAVENGEALVLSLQDQDGAGNYPGNLTVQVTYTLTQAGLFVHYEADCDADTVLNMTTHAYFNLKGYDGGDVLDHTLYIDADTFTAVDERLIPQELRPVVGTPFDFTTPHTVGERIEADYDQILLGSGYDHNYWLTQKTKETFGDKSLTRAAILRGGELTLTCYTDKPCLQIYTGNFMGGDTPFKGGVKTGKWHAICLETQYAPDSPNHGQAILKKGEHYDFTTAFTVAKA